MSDTGPFPDPRIKASVYLVGGAVRDRLLGRAVHERDWVVVGATSGQLLAAGYRQADPDFPVFLHPDSGEEYALARRETKVAEGYRGFAVDVSPQVSLEQDLARRDLTINAMAQAADGRLIDPFAGRDDLEQGRLRHVTAAFVEDPVRLLRIARFAAQLGDSFRVAHTTQRLLRQMVADGAMAQLQPQRLGRELFKALAGEAPWRFFEVLAGCGALAALLPGLAVEIQAGHGKTASSQALRALRRISRVTPEPSLRLVALVLQSGDRLEALPGRLDLGRAATRLLRAAGEAWGAWQSLALDDAQAVAAFLQRLRCWGNDGVCESVLQVLAAQSADDPRIDRLRQALAAARTVSVASLQQQGLTGTRLGEALAGARERAIRRALS